MKGRVILTLVLVTLVLLTILFLLLNQRISSVPENKDKMTNYSHNNGDSAFQLMASNTTFSLLGGWGPSLSYPIAEIYTPYNSILVSTFLWNIQSAKGFVNMTFSHGHLNVSIRLSHVVKIQKGLSVDGYPTLMYGKESWFPFYASTIDIPRLELPQKLTTLPKFSSTVDFSVYDFNGTVDDFSYDIWLSQNPNVTYLQYPCVEIMIWMYHEENISSQYFVEEGALTVQAIVNGSKENVTFTVYVLPHTGSSNGWIGVYYVSNEDLEGNVTLPLSYLIIHSFYFIDKVFPSLSASEYYLDAIQVGMEFNDENGYADLGYSLYGWWISF
ncbi:hypothetical protein DDW09_04885 [Sulfolobus sp. SCGC AB-777_L09]|nr:hypothetical protein DDW09_04885 [Sulfolobus sp. SCGC AB-777_L09]